MKIYHIKTVQDILNVIEIFAECIEEYKVYNSCFNIEGTKKSSLFDLEPIAEVYPIENCVNYSYNTKHEALNVVEFINKLKKCTQTNGLKRDTEDGYIFSDYETIIIRDDLKIIILL